jgi:SAM-dependent methyltransferase
MRAEALEPFGSALLAFLDGDTSANFLIRRDDGKESALPASYFFRDESGFTEIEKTAIARCEGHVLDVGAGTGSQSIALQRKGLSVTALDLSPGAVAVARRRGVRKMLCADIFKLRAGPFDTLLMLGHGIGMVETVDGLKRFLVCIRSLLRADGQLLVDSVDVRVTDDPDNLRYHEANKSAGRYIGEIRMQFEFRGKRGPYCGWLHVDAETLAEHSRAAGLDCDVVHRDGSGNYLARITNQSRNDAQ